MPEWYSFIIYTMVQVIIVFWLRTQNIELVKCMIDQHFHAINIKHFTMCFPGPTPTRPRRTRRPWPDTVLVNNQTYPPASSTVPWSTPGGQDNSLTPDLTPRAHEISRHNLTPRADEISTRYLTTRSHDKINIIIIISPYKITGYAYFVIKWSVICDHSIINLYFL